MKIFLVNQAFHDYEGSWTSPLHAFSNADDAESFVKEHGALQTERQAARLIVLGAHDEFAKLNPPPIPPSGRSAKKIAAETKKWADKRSEWQAQHAVYVRQKLVEAGVSERILTMFDAQGWLAHETLSYEIEEVELD